LLKHLIPCAFFLAEASAGSSIAAKMAMMAMTTNNSMSVNARERVAWKLNFCILQGREHGDELDMAFIQLNSGDT
jgi:hypothetical protein